MTARVKTADSLTVQDLQSDPVWEYILDESIDDLDETAVRPAESIPVADLGDKIVGTEIQLANGARLWGVIANLDTGNARRTLHFLSLSVASRDEWFHLARYHDYDYDERGPSALAQFLGLSVAEVFPISYDLTAYVSGDAASLKGSILAEVGEKLTEDEIISLAVG